MMHRLARTLVIGVGVLAFSPAGAPAATPSTTLVSVTALGTPGNYGSYEADVSADGRFVVFVSDATNLLATPDPDFTTDVFLRDRKLGTTKRLSASDAGVAADDSSDSPRISDDGRYVFFESGATNLVAGAGSGNNRLYRYDRAASTLSLLPLPGGATSVSRNGSAPVVQVSADGSRAAFRAAGQVWWWDAGTGSVQRASQTATGVAASGGAGDPAISGDGKSVAFFSASTNLDATPSGYQDIYLKTLATGALVRVSDTGPTGTANLHSSTPTISSDGCQVAFFSDATNLVTGIPAYPAGANNVYVRDMCGGTGMALASVDNSPTPVRFKTLPPVAISNNGCRIVFLGEASGAAWMRDRCAGARTRIDLTAAGDAGAGGLNGVGISGGSGRYVVFSTTSVMTPPDGNADFDVFIRDLATNTAPDAAITASVSGQAVTADATASSDPDGYQLTGTINWGDGSLAQPGFSGVHTYATPGTYGVTVTVVDSDGASDTAISAVTIADPGLGVVPPTTPPPGGIGGQGAGDTPAQLILDRVSLSRSSFGVAAKGKKAGSELALRLNGAANVTLTFERVRTGRKVKGRCKVGARKGARCTKATLDGASTLALQSGTSTIPLTGRLGLKKLATGTHRVTIRARGADGQVTASKVLTFTITAAKKKKPK